MPRDYLFTPPQTAFILTHAAALCSAAQLLGGDAAEIRLKHFVDDVSLSSYPCWPASPVWILNHDHPWMGTPIRFREGLSRSMEHMLKWDDSRDHFGMGGKLKKHELEKYPVGTVIVTYTDPVS